ncbi:aspartyl protease family protein [Sphingomonas sp. PP-CE-1G-424]|uniref:aspartyl protease family protein n=1 Tax=Sphingomonas sp. PP-CE-1G-424 TaxID=2135658 RepID=UPI001055CEAA|nr:aspartyl protease family protein [Sphingomonas sp. PP-CE-1G-424]TCP73137.1 aspartyl protease [Sphingomonas sp. PP-CE-1G-424]
MTGSILRGGAVALVLIGSAAFAADKSAPVRDVPIDGMISATIDGTPVTLRVDPGAPGLVLMTTAAAERLGLKGGMMELGYSVGGHGAMQATTVRPMTFGSAPVKRRIGFPSRRKASADGRWIGRAYATVGDGSIGPGSLPEPVVRIALRTPRPGERTIALPMVDGGGLFGRLSGEFAQIVIGGQPVRVRFDPYHPRTTVTANAAALIAEAQRGTLTGVAEPVEIAFGITRPVRTMTLATPLAVGPLLLSTLGVRTSDVGSAASIPEADAAPPDPDEIVVTAKGKRDPKRDRLTIGADLLDRCSTIVFDKPAKQVRLTCG